MNVFLARHGQTEENLSRIFQGHLPGHLTEEGRRQAVALGESLKDIALDAIVSSDLQRVVDTVRLAVGDRGLPWEKNALFREIDWGSWTGLCFMHVQDGVSIIFVRIMPESRYWSWRTDRLTVISWHKRKAFR